MTYTTRPSGNQRFFHLKMETFNNLPKAAKKELERMEYRLQDHKKELEELKRRIDKDAGGLDSSNDVTYVDLRQADVTTLHREHPLPHGAHVTFHLSGYEPHLRGDRIECYVEQDKELGTVLRVGGYSRLVVYPDSTNTFRVAPARPRRIRTREVEAFPHPDKAKS